MTSGEVASCARGPASTLSAQRGHASTQFFSPGPEVYSEADLIFSPCLERREKRSEQEAAAKAFWVVCAVDDDSSSSFGAKWVRAREKRTQEFSHTKKKRKATPADCAAPIERLGEIIQRVCRNFAFYNAKPHCGRSIQLRAGPDSLLVAKSKKTCERRLKHLLSLVMCRLFLSCSCRPRACS